MRVVSFVNRELGARVAIDLARERALDLVAVVTNDPPNDDVALEDMRSEVPILTWSQFRLRAHSFGDLDRGVSVLFRHHIPPSVLATLPGGVVNLHPSLLPFGRGSCPATWAIWEETPYGGSAHLMVESIDAGPILAQLEVPIEETDTSFSLYGKGLDSLWTVFEAAVVPWLRGKPFTLRDQPPGGSNHSRADVLALQALDPGGMPNEVRERWARALDVSPRCEGSGAPDRGQTRPDSSPCVGRDMA